MSQVALDQIIESHPLRVRGLKPFIFHFDRPAYLSHPLRVRGLKPLPSFIVMYHPVASFTGAWIETTV